MQVSISKTIEVLKALVEVEMFELLHLK